MACYESYNTAVNRGNWDSVLGNGWTSWSPWQFAENGT